MVFVYTSAIDMDNFNSTYVAIRIMVELRI